MTGMLQAEDGVPLRAELFNAEQMERHGQTLAQHHKLRPQPGADLLRDRLSNNEKQLRATYAVLRLSASDQHPVAPAGEWLLDNFYLIEEQIRTARQHFSRGYSRALPQLAKGPARGLPRVYDIALEVISHGDGRLDLESLRRLITAYQSAQVLSLGELWAIPIMLRLAMIENLRRVGTRIAQGLAERNRAARWADQMLHAEATDPKSLILVVADMARSNPPMANAFVAELVRRLRGQSSGLSLPLSWIELCLAETGMRTEQAVQAETQNQAANQLSISNSITSLRVLGATDWREFVEALSPVEHGLREDPAGVYARMDFATRDRYRHVVERLARGSRQSELLVTRAAIALASEAALHPGAPAQARAGHVGHYLIGLGLPALKARIGLRLSPWQRLGRLAQAHPLTLYLGAIATLSLLFGAHLLLVASGQRSHGPGFWLALAALALLACSQLAVTLVNWLVTLLAPPSRLPRMDFSLGIAAGSRTLVVVPTLLTSSAGAERLAEALELRFLANQDAQLCFGLLTDFADAAQEQMPEDAVQLQTLRACMAALNARYGRPGLQPFYLFHRPRRWNAADRTWMGYERKRGKLAALNRLIRLGEPQDFDLVLGDMAALREVRYVITLDTDTQLPRDAGRGLVGTMAHPLNQAVYDPLAQRVTQGYGILQPRMAATLPSTNRSHYARLFGGERGVDPYTGAVSDVYQDMFHEGSFIGKGIYDVALFEQALDARFPDNRILSHDLLEGCYARCALVSDVILYEDTPAEYLSDIKRRHRWTRGDWQIAAWLFSRVPLAGRRSAPNPLPALSQWKLLDNLRRSLVAPGLLALLVLGWSLLGGGAAWTLAVLGIVFFPSLASTLVEACRKPEQSQPGQHLRLILQTLARKFAQGLFELACLPFEAWTNLDAVLRTEARLWFTHRRLLEWQASGEAALPGVAPPSGRAAPPVWSRALWPAPVLALLLSGGLVLDQVLHGALAQAQAWWLVAPILLLWLVQPLLVRAMSLPLRDTAKPLAAAQILFLRRLARKTWHFFDTFVTAQENWLPPDNYQELPQAVVAHRTSPTNIGLSLLATLTAHDFAYLYGAELVERTRNTLRTLQGMPRHLGHFYNWYDTRTLAPLTPLYVSTVDSGNLAGHLLTLRAGLLALPAEPVLSARLFDGLHDSLGLVLELSGQLASQQIRRQAQALAGVIEGGRSAPPATAFALRNTLAQTELACGALLSACAAWVPASAAQALVEWVTRLAAQARAAQAELLHLLPWADQPASALPAPLQALPTLNTLATLDGELLATRTPELRALLALSRTRALARLAELQALAQQAQDLARMEWDFLNDPARHLLRIGYNIDQRRLDDSCYDLLASEARLASYVAIAQDQLPQENWFALGRLLTSAGGPPVLLSWSGSMFEYLMPLLVMPSYTGTLLDQTCRSAVQRQIAYGNERDVPWGISESGYNAVDASLNYQYHAFGVPGSGLKRGLAEDLVIAPYASALALLVLPEAACQNLQRLAALGLDAAYGLYEALDYTPSRLPRGRKSAPVQSFMAHHQGMSLLAFGHVLLGQPMQRRFLADPMLQATTLLLHERIPNPSRLQHETAGPAELRAVSAGPEMPMRVVTEPERHKPEVQLLSNGRYHVMLTHAGSGYSRWNGMDVTRWREDATGDPWGQFCYLRDVASQQFWSVGHQPARQASSGYEAIFSEGRAEFRRSDDGYDTHAEIAVSPEDDIELRRLHITNNTRVRRTLEVTSYAEVVLAPTGSDGLHPAFSNLFVETEIVADRQAIVCTRRPRASSEPRVWMLHLMSVHGAAGSEVSFETDRKRFVGRTRSLESPQALHGTPALSGADGAVLDPIVAIRHRIVLEPQQTITLDMVTGVAPSREQALGLVDKYRDKHLADRVFDLAWTHGWVSLQQINASEADAQLFGRLAGAIIYADASRRADASVQLRNRRGQSGLWSYAISGDLPIVLLQIADTDHIALVRQLVQAHAYWRLKGLSVDLVIWNEDHAGYRQVLHEQIMGLIASGLEANLAEKPGGIFVRIGEQIPEEDRHLFMSVARVILSDARGTLAEQIGSLKPTEHRKSPVRRRVMDQPDRSGQLCPSLQPQRGLVFDNGLGGFSEDGREYVINLAEGASTPAPWVNVIANAQLGTVVSESGGAYTWFQNAHEYRLSPWSNDAVSDSCGEALYLRDEESGRYWSPTPLPCGGPALSVVRHGFGYTVFEHETHGIHSRLSIHVDAKSALKISVLTVRNCCEHTRKLSATGYVEWVLGDFQSRTAMHVQTERDSATGTLYAQNAYSPDFAQLRAFFDAGDASNDPQVSYSGDRAEFLGHLGSWRHPAGMRQVALSNRVGAGLDPCAAVRVPFNLEPGQTRELVFRLGGMDPADQSDSGVVSALRHAAAAHDSRRAVEAGWAVALGAVQVRTPDAALNLLFNGWLLYQTQSCRLWGRSGFYQSGGAYGFRDQLQDSMALVYAQPALTRAHLLRAAAHQFEEGDAQHWWHPPGGRGVRTRCSDDFLWLAQALCHYVQVSGDRGILDEHIAFLSGRAGQPRGRLLLRHAAGIERFGQPVPACAARRATGLALWRAWPAADGHGRLERRHEPGGHGRARRERLAGLLPARLPEPLRAAGALVWRRGLRAAMRPAGARSGAGHRAARLGRRLVPGVPTLTTARRWARPAMRNARSIRSRKAGRCLRAWATPRARAPPCRRCASA